MNEGETMETGTSAAMVVVKGAVGTLTPVLGVVVSVMSEVEAWLRIGSLIVGIAVGVASFISIVRKMKGNP